MSNESHREILASHPFTNGLGREQLERLLSCSCDRIYGTGDFLCREGEPADSFFLIWEGRASLEAHVVRHGGLRIETVHPGEVLGWSWMVPPHRWRLDARAIEPVRAVVIDSPALRKICEQDHEIGFQVLKRLAQVVGHRLTRTRKQLIDLHGRAPRGARAGPARSSAPIRRKNPQGLRNRGGVAANSSPRRPAAGEESRSRHGHANCSRLR